MPKVKKLVSSYDNLPLAFVETSSPNEISGQLSVFAAPAVIVFADGREMIRESRFISIESLKYKIDRLIGLMDW